MIIRQHWRNSMLHSASCLELVLLATLRWYVIPSALGNHHTNQTKRNDRHNWLLQYLLGPFFRVQLSYIDDRERHRVGRAEITGDV